MRLRVITNNKVATNPVARAIAMKKVHDRLMAAKLRIYMLEAGQDDSANLVGVQAVMRVVGKALALEYDPKPDSMPVDILRDTRILRGGLSALTSCMCKWDPNQAVAIEQGIDAAERLNRVAKTEHIHMASVTEGVVVS